jgi:hypothetical protein
LVVLLIVVGYLAGALLLAIGVGRWFRAKAGPR